MNDQDAIAQRISNLETTIVQVVRLLARCMDMIDKNAAQLSDLIKIQEDIQADAK